MNPELVAALLETQLLKARTEVAAAHAVATRAMDHATATIREADDIVATLKHTIDRLASALANAGEREHAATIIDDLRAQLREHHPA